MEEMTTAEFNKMMETLANLVESKATTVEEAVEMIRDMQIKA